MIDDAVLKRVWDERPACWAASGHVTAVDVSKETIERTRVNLADLDNVTLILGDGARSPVCPFIVFQHIPSTEVIYSYCKEVCRGHRTAALMFRH